MGQGMAERRKGHHWEALNDLCSLLWDAGEKQNPWCRIVIVPLFLLGWPRSRTSLTGNKSAAGRGPVEEPIRRVEQQLSSADLPQNRAVHL